MNTRLAVIVIFIAGVSVCTGISACKKSSDKGLLGIVVPVGQDKVKKDAPYIITGVYEETPAYRAGLRPGDRIVQINSVVVDGLRYDHIYNNLLLGPSGTKVTIVVERDGKTRVVDMVRGAMPGE